MSHKWGITTIVVAKGLTDSLLDSLMEMDLHVSGLKCNNFLMEGTGDEDRLGKEGGDLTLKMDKRKKTDKGCAKI